MSAPAAVDLDPETRRALELDALLDWVASLASTAAGAALVRESVPSADARAVRSALDAAAETGRELREHGRLVPALLPDPRAAAAGLEVEGLVLEARPLHDLALVLEAAGAARSRLATLPREESPELRRLSDSIPDLRREVQPILKAIDAEGRIADDASPELRRIRAASAQVAERLRRALERRLRDPSSESVIRDAFITRRNDRFVIPVRVDAPHPVKGIVHASSSSGATLFVEPLESVEMNNDLVRLAEEERKEEWRILTRFTAALAARAADVRQSLSGLAELDALCARARFAHECSAVNPEVAEGGPLSLAGARHPLLDRRLRESGLAAVPLDLVLDPADTVLVISGPNTGGKTVALKTVGLAALMAQSGIPVPAREARLPLYAQVRADIGDHQSIQADLSTFSAHIRSLGEFLAAPRPPALFLFDEIGTGTEPSEGAALAQAILESLLRSGITALVTTHLGALKAWSFTTEGASSAAMEFDAESLRPTYRFRIGAAGVSAGIEIAERLGLPQPVIERARAVLDPSTRRTEEYLRRLREELASAEAERASLAAREADLASREREIEGERRRSEERLRESATAALDRAVTRLREMGRRELAAIRDERERKRVERRFTAAEQRVGSERARVLEELVGPKPRGREGWVVPASIEPGMRVWVAKLDREGTVAALRGDRVEVALGGITLTESASELRVPAPGAPRPAAPSPPVRARSREPEPESRAPRELHLVGQRVEEALEGLDRYLDGAQLAGHEEVRVVHGHGTGRLRAAVRRFLDSHPQVAGHRPGRPEEGGDGATVVRIR